MLVRGERFVQAVGGGKIGVGVRDYLFAAETVYAATE